MADTARAHGALLFVDAYQTLGIEPLDVRQLDIDFLSSGAHKFLLGSPGIGFLYVRRELIERLEPALTGWFGREDIFAFDAKRLDWATTARRFEMATPPVPAAYAARAGLSVIQEVSPRAIHAWTRALSSRLLEGAARRGLIVHGTTDATRKTPTTAIVCAGDSADMEKRLRSRGIQAAARGPVIRLAPHFFTTVEDVDAALDAVAEIQESGGKVNP